MKGVNSKRVVLKVISNCRNYEQDMLQVAFARDTLCMPVVGFVRAVLAQIVPTRKTKNPTS